MATKFEFKITGTKKLFDAIQSVKDKLDDRILEIVKDTTLAVEATAKKSMRTGGGEGHSRPGQPPFVQSGQLRANVTHKLPSLIFGKEIEGKVGVRSNIKYAMALEYGYPPRNLKERPFMRPALAKEKPGFERKVKNILSGITK